MSEFHQAFDPERKNKKAVKYLTDLSRFVRDILQTSKLPTVSLEEELELTKKYIKLEESRFEEKLQFELCLENIEEKELKSSKIPPMLLQPFVENSIWHGLLPSQSEDKKLRIAVSQRDNGIFISIMDNGIGRQTKAQTQLNGHKSMGVTITQQRIDLFNKITNQRMQMDTLDHFDQNKKPSGTEVQIHLNES
nr:histidine kinase [Indibacter alkaliphilus]